MASYLNIYVIDSKTKEKKRLTYYGGSSEMYHVFKDILDPPYYYSGSIDDDEEDKSKMNYRELTHDNLERCIEQVNKWISNYKDVAEKEIKAYEEAKSLFVEALVKKNISINDIKNSLIDYTYDKYDSDADYIKELEGVKNDLEFLQYLIDSWYEDDFNGLACNMS